MTLEEAKAYLRLESSGEDALVSRLVASAIALAEAYLGTVLVRRTVVETLAAGDGPAWRRLGSVPVAEIGQVERIASDGSGSALAAESYAIDIDSRGEGWVRTSGGGRLRVTYTAGMAEAAEQVPAPIAQGITRLAAHLYARRDDSSGPPAAVAALWRPYRRLRLGLERRA